MVRIATWNIVSLYIAGKLSNIEAEMSALNIDKIRESEVWSPGFGKLRQVKDMLFRKNRFKA